MGQAWGLNLSWITSHLAVGGSFAAAAAPALAAEHEIGAVVDLRAEACDDAQGLAACGVRFLHLPTPDHHGVAQPMLDEGVRFAEQAHREARRLLIHCEHGIGRSATLALCVLVAQGWAPLPALSLAKAARAAISPSPAQYEAWVVWLRRRAPKAEIPPFDAFRAIAYRHLDALA